MMQQARRIIFFDLETLRTFDEVGGRQNLDRLGLAVAVTYDSSADEYHAYLEDQAAELVDELANADLVVGFNLLGFDYPVLRPYTEHPLETLPTVDLLRDVCLALGFRLSLQTLAEGTLGIGKSADGLQAVRWFRQGEVEKVIEYCRQDVELTRRLYEFGHEHGHVLFWDRSGQMRKVHVLW
jgi:DEAD/DEAH box helicase domain-containing protein